MSKTWSPQTIGVELPGAGSGTFQRTFCEAVQVTGVVLTKLDGSARGGIVVAVQEELGIPVKAVGVGETAADLELFDPRTFVDALVEVPDSAA